MFIFGVLLAFIMTFAKVLDTLLNKKIMVDIDPKLHSLYRIIFVSPILLFAALLNWQLSYEAIILITIYSVFEAFNILFHQMSLSKVEPELVDLISKSKILTVLIFGVAFSLEKIELHSVIGSILFVAGIILMMDLNFRKKNEIKNNKIRLLGIFFQIVSVLCRTAKPFILKHILLNQYASNETVVFLSMPISFITIYLLFRPKIDFNQIKTKIKPYILQSILVAISMILMGYALLFSNVLTVSIIESFSVIILAVLSMIASKKLLKTNKLIGCVIGVIGIIIVIMN